MRKQVHDNDKDEEDQSQTKYTTLVIFMNHHFPYFPNFLALSLQSKTYSTKFTIQSQKTHPQTENHSRYPWHPLLKVEEGGVDARRASPSMTPSRLKRSA